MYEDVKTKAKNCVREYCNEGTASKLNSIIDNLSVDKVLYYIRKGIFALVVLYIIGRVYQFVFSKKK